ncbi:hypothetical protein AB0M39_27345 [Streptomyces sp. NPDC051907]|uniref:hypothetical protein n=1 Tax=Streptomyces sp. NPDC051907 TaxID=3155284 RepID=UPI0034305C09
MSRLITRLGDRVLERLVPAADAQADTSYYRYCYCRNVRAYYRLCHVVGGTSSCSGCTYARGEC